MVINPYKLLMSGFVRRWHSNPHMADCGETLAEHQWSVAMIALILKPDLSREALINALTHDVGELEAGDLAAPFKRLHGEVAALHATAEHHYRMGIVDTSVAISDADDYETIRLADGVSAYLRMMWHRPALAENADWQEMLRALMGNMTSKQKILVAKLIHKVERNE